MNKKETININNPKNSNILAKLSIVLGVLSIFLFEIGIIPLIAVIISIWGLFRIKRMDKKFKILLVIGCVLSFVYFVAHLYKFSGIVNNRENFKERYLTTTIDSSKQAPKIKDMTFTKQKDQTENLYWWFSDEIDKNLANNQWGCYKNCNMVFANSNNIGENFAIDLSDNNCLMWIPITIEKKEILKNYKNFCVVINCSSGIKSEKQCFSLSGDNF